MRTTLTLDDALVEKLVKATGQTRPSRAIRTALQGYLRQQDINKVLALRGEIDLNDEWSALRQLDNWRVFSSSPAIDRIKESSK